MTSEGAQKLSAAVFIDGQNMFGGQKVAEWRIDYEKLKSYLFKHYSVKILKYFGGIDTRPESPVGKRQEKFYKNLQRFGYEVFKKPVIYRGTLVPKCDIDADLAKEIGKLTNNIKMVILFSGDSDYLSVLQDLHSEGRSVRIYSFKRALSWQLKMFAARNSRCNYAYLDNLREDIEQKGPQVA